MSKSVFRKKPYALNISRHCTSCVLDKRVDNVHNGNVLLHLTTHKRNSDLQKLVIRPDDYRLEDLIKAQVPLQPMPTNGIVSTSPSVESVVNRIDAIAAAAAPQPAPTPADNVPNEPKNE